MHRFEKGARYYLLGVCHDLLGDWVVTRIFGRIGQAQGQIRHQAFAQEADARAYLDAEIQRRIKRGYAVCHRHERGGGGRQER